MTGIDQGTPQPAQSLKIVASMKTCQTQPGTGYAGLQVTCPAFFTFLKPALNAASARSEGLYSKGASVSIRASTAANAAA